MIAAGMASWRGGGPIMGRCYVNPPLRKGIMAKLKSAWEGLGSGSSGTYIRPLSSGGSYEFGRWHHGWAGHWRFERLGERPTTQACKEALALADKEVERKARLLGKRKARHG